MGTSAELNAPVNEDATVFDSIAEAAAIESAASSSGMHF